MTTSNTVYVNRKFNCSPSELFKWIVDPALIPKWFGPKHLSVKSVHTDFRIGGDYRIELLKPDDTSFFIAGTYLKITEPTLLEFRFVYEGLNMSPQESIVKITLEELSPSSTQLALIQKFEVVPADMEGRTIAWEHMFLKLSDTL